MDQSTATRRCTRWSNSIRRREKPIPFANRLLPRLAVDSVGKLYLTAYNGAGWVFSFDPDLTLRWKELLPGAEGPALGEGGILAVTGTGTELRTYQEP